MYLGRPATHHIGCGILSVRVRKGGGGSLGIHIDVF